MIPVAGYGGEVTLEWTPCDTADHYVAYWGAASGNYTQNSPDIPQPTSGTVSLPYTVTGLTEGTTYYFAVKAFNTFGQSTDYSNEVSTTIVSEGINAPPTANAGTDQSHPETTDGIPTPITLNASGSTDPDGTISAYHWARVDSHSDITTILSSPTAAQPSFNAPGVATDTTLEFELTVTDNEGAIGTDRVLITITNVNQAPMANAGTDQTHPETTSGAPTTVTLNGTDSSDPDGTINAYAWTRTDALTGFSISMQHADTATPSFTAPDVTTNTTFEFQLAVTDNMGATDTDQVKVTITSVNEVPTANAGPDQIQPETTNGAPTTVTLNGADSSDPDGPISLYTWTRTDTNTGIPISLQNAGTATPSFAAPDVTTDTPLEFELTVTDNKGATDSDRVQVTITNVNRPPMASAGPDQTQPETTDGAPTTVTLNGTNSSDPDGSISNYAWTRTDTNTGVSVSLQNANTATTSFAAPEVTTDTTLEFQLTVTDNLGAQSTDRVQTTITNINQDPTANAGPDQTQPETTNGSPTTVTLNGTNSSDPDGSISSYAWTRTDTNTGVSVSLQNADTATPSFAAPDVATDTTFEFELTVTDNDEATATDRVQVTVTSINKPPEAIAGPDQTQAETTDGAPTTITLNGADSSDPDGTISSYAWSRTDTNTDIQVSLQNADTATPSFEAPDVTANTTLEFQLTVTDNEQATGSDRVRITITNVNRPPTANAGPDQTQPETTGGSPTTVTLNGADSSDPDGTISRYAWIRTDTNTSLPISLQNADTATPTFVSPAVNVDTSVEFQLTVTDNSGATSTDGVRITITNVNQAPTANAGADQSQPETIDGSPTTVTLNGTGSSDSDGAISSYAWTRTDTNTGFPISLQNADTATPTFVAPAVTADTSFEFQLTVTDNEEATATDNVRITITNINQAPTANAGPDQTLPETTGGAPTTVSLNGTGSSDPDGSINTYSWTRTDTNIGVSVPLQNANTATPSFSAPAVAADTTLEFQLTVTDNEEATATDRVQVTITNINQAPTANAGPDQTQPETTGGTPTTVSLNGTQSNDPDGSIASYAWIRTDTNTGAAVSLQNADTATPSFAAPPVTESTPLEFELTVTDNNGATGTDRVRTTITNVNQAPEANAGPNQTVREGISVTLDGTRSTDPDGSVTHWLWEQVPAAQAPSIPLTGADTTTASFTAPDVDTNGAAFTFKLTVTDNEGATASATTIVNVTFDNQPPVADAGQDQAVTEGAPVTLTAENSSDPDDGIASYQWTQTAGPPVNLSDESTVKPTFTAPDVESAGATLVFQAMVTDQGGLSSTDTVQIVVENANQLPTANPGMAQSLPETTNGVPTTVTLNGTGSTDPDGSITRYAWKRIDSHTELATLLDNAVSPTPAFSAPAVMEDTALTFELTVTDNDGATARGQVQVTITNVNQPPTANAGPDQTQPETTNGSPTTITLNGTASQDPDGTLSRYSWRRSDNLSNITTIINNPDTASPFFVSPDVDADTPLEFELSVTDNDGATAQDTMRVTLTRVNQPPMADAGPEQTVNEQTEVRLSAANSSDPDGTISSWRWDQVVGPQDPVVSLSGASTETATFTAPNVDADGTSLTFRLTVTDNEGATHSDTAIVNVTFDNQPPVAQAGPDQTVVEGASVTLSADNSTDPDNDPISLYLWEQLSGPVVTLTNADAPTASFTAPDVGPSGATLLFKLTVTDNGGLSATDDIIVNVTFDNQPPVADAGANQTISEGETVSLSAANSVDPDDGIASYKWSQTTGTPVPLSNSTDISPTFTAPSVESAGTQLTFMVTVTDMGGLTASDTVLINITNLNQPPVAEAGKRQSVRAGDEVTLSAAGSNDPDGTIATYQWMQMAGPVVPLSDASSPSPAFTAPSVDKGGESLTFELKVTDNEGLSATDQVIVNVLHANKPPVAIAGTDFSATEETTVTLSGAESTDPDDGISAYRWEQVDGSTVTLTDPDSSVTTLTTPEVTPEGETLTFRLNVTDTGGLSATDEVTLAVTSVNQPPIASAGTDQQVSEGATVTLSAASSHDPDNNLAGYLWEQIGGPSVTLLGSDTATATFTAPDVDSQGARLLFQVIATDTEGLTATDTCAVQTVFVNQTPQAHAGGDQSVEEGQTVTLDGTASQDPDDGISSWSWTQTMGPPVTLTSPGEPVTRFVAPKSHPGGIELAFTLIVTDNGGLTQDDSCTVWVTLSETSPTADTSNASIEILDNQMEHQDWLSIGWDSYRKNNNEARVASGDLDGDGNNEIVIGLGPVKHDSAIPAGFFQILSHDYKHLAWGQIPWAEYNDFNGETWPACGDLNGDGVDEIVMGLGKGGDGQVAVFSYSRGHVTHLQWAFVPWEDYNEALGETRPACGNIDDDPCMEIVVGLGSDMENNITADGRYAVLDKACDGNLTTPFELRNWGQGEWTEYNATNGATWPTCGDIDGDAQDEILLGLGSGGGGKTEIVKYMEGTPQHQSWLNVDWNEYNTQHGETRPACSDITGDGTDEVIIGLGPVADNEQLPAGRFPAMYADQFIYQWGQLNLAPYNRENGESRPIPFLSNKESLLAIGLGSYTPDAGEPETTLQTELTSTTTPAECFINTCRPDQADKK